MHRQRRTRGIVLRRVDYGEADRIITFITPDEGLISAMVKGVRKQGSKLAGGIELFSESDLTFVGGKGELDLLISSRLITHFGSIVTDYTRVDMGYQAIQIAEKTARVITDPQAYDLLYATFEALNTLEIPVATIEAWFRLNVLRILGQQPNLTHDVAGSPLQADQTYTLLPDDGAFSVDDQGVITTQHIKAWRVLLTAQPQTAHKIGGVDAALADSSPYIRHLFEYQFIG